MKAIGKTDKSMDMGVVFMSLAAPMKETISSGGYYVHGKQQGPGMWSIGNGGIIYEGSMKDTKLHGFGARTLKNSTCLYGQWQN